MKMPRGSGYIAPTALLSPGNYGEWFLELAPYIKNTQIFNCPSASRTAFQTGGVDSTALGYGVAYSRNLFIDRTAMADITEPANCIIMADGINNYMRLYCKASEGGNYGWSWNRHNDGCNYTFVDGHVKWMKIDPATQFATRDAYMHLSYHP